MTAFFNKPLNHGTENEHGGVVKEAPLACLMGMAIPTFMTIYLFFDPQVFYRLSLTLANF
jgi:multicomponent Na+:H+ antiporter subunit D